MMGRKRKASVVEDLMEIISLLPWWAGVTLAVLGYLVLHAFAAPIPAGAVKTGQIGSLALNQLGYALARIGQYVFPLMCLIAAAVSFARSHGRRTLHDTVAQEPELLAGISWQQFEQLVGEAFRRQGFAVKENSTAGPDGGVDLVLHKGKEMYLVQCKQWRAQQVGVPIVRELYGAMAAVGAAGGYVVTSGRFTAEARAFANGRNIWLVDGDELRDWIQWVGKPVLQAVKAAPAGKAAPDCPVCDSPMMERIAKKGANAGNRFWGCSRYPQCRGTRDR